ncbi:MAG: septum formation inhibitor Maf [Nevskia sp.]|nr:septum formation inhibitor Maf [Nevskia sp.]
MTAISEQSPLILASTSRYRAELLRRLGVPFEQEAPGSDETPRSGEAPKELAQRLALAKAQAVAARHPQRWVLGSDQVCACGDELLGKPGDRQLAIGQLTRLSGNSARFFTAVALVQGASGTLYEALDLTTVHFRRLDAEEIERYVAAEPAFDCAGSFKSEGLGIALCEAIESRDQTGLVGLPLIAVRELLLRAGLALP